MLLEYLRVNAITSSSGKNEETAPADDLLKQSLLYREFRAEREEILRHKWFESEKKGHDIGFELAQIDWRIKHRSLWRKEWKSRRSPATF